MRIRQAIFVAVLAAACSGGDDPVPAPARSAKLLRAAEPISGKYLVRLADGRGQADADALAARFGGSVLAFHASLGTFELALPPERAFALAEDPAVRLLEEDSLLRLASVVPDFGWNLDRVDQRSPVLDGWYLRPTTGAGVHVYVVDTPIRLDHAELAGRADAPFAAVADATPPAACNGHGTHLAGLAAGATHGVAPGATVHGVAAVDCAGAGSVSSLVAAIAWILENHASPAVVLVGATAGLSPTLADALRALVADGVAVVAPAGNDGVDACERLPAAAADVIAVGAATDADAVASFSNQGRCVDLFAPGAEVESAWTTAADPFLVASGTSQAAAHVAGAAALFLSDRPAAAPATVENAIVGNATVGALSGLSRASPDRLLFVRFPPAAPEDGTAPSVAFDAPQEGATVADAVTLSATATDSGTGVVQVAFYVDGAYVGADADPAGGYQVTWSTEAAGNGVHGVVARAFDAAGNTADAAREVTVENLENADWDAALGVPACATPGSRCASGPLLEGRGPVGPEAHAPNTVAGLCADGAAGTYRRDESVEAIEVRSAGADLAEGVLVDVSVKVWAYPDFASDRVDLYFAADAAAPDWQFAATSTLEGEGEQSASFRYRLPAFPGEARSALQAVRAVIRYGGVAAECTSGLYDDHDDLAFAVKPGTPDLVLPAVSIVAPAAGARLTEATALVAEASDDGGTISRVELFAGESLVGTAHAADADGMFRVTWDVDAWPIASYALTAVAYDASGNAGPSEPVAVHVVDTVPPAVAIAIPDPGAVVGGIVHVEASATDNRKIARVQFRSGATVIGTAVTPPWAVDWDTTALAGPASVVAQAWDGSDNTATTTPLPVFVDNAPPTAEIAYPTAGLEVSGPVTVDVIAADEDDEVARVEIFVAGGYSGDAVWDPARSRWAYRWNSGTLRNGPVTLRARAFDRAGNRVDSDPVEVVVNDTTPPAVAVVVPEPGFVHGVVPVLATANDEAVISRVEFLLNGAALEEDPYVPYQIEWDTTTVPDGEAFLSAKAWDLGENVGESAAVRVVVDNTGPATTLASSADGTASGTVELTVEATDLSGVDHVDIWASELLVGTAELVPPDPATEPGAPAVYRLAWATTDHDNRAFAVRAVAFDILGNVAESNVVPQRVSNVTTAEYDPALGAPACATPAAWCFSGTLLHAAAAGEQNQPNTLGGKCADGADSAYGETETVERVKVATADGGTLAPGAEVIVTVRYWAYAANEADQIDVYHAADARAPAWILRDTLTPAQVGLNEQQVRFVLPTGPLQAVRANFRFAQPGPAPCSAGAYGDRDDLAFAAGSPVDVAPPSVAIASPSPGGVVSGDVVVRASASDDVGLARVEIWADGALLETDLAPPFEAVWPAALAADGAHTLAARAFDTSGNVAESASVAVTVRNAVTAAFDDALGAPACAEVESFCDPGALLDGRGPVGPEANAPNTLLASCDDGVLGAYHVDESLDGLKVSSVDGLPLAAGKRARIEARVWAYDAWSDDALDLYATTTPDDPHWIHVATLLPAGPGAQTLSAEYVLPPSGFQAVRGRYRAGGVPQACGGGAYDDHDDLAFAVEYTPNAAHDPALGAPACSGAVSSCDPGSLLDGRGPLGPELNAPNTFASACADGTVGTYHVDASVDAVRVRSGDGAPLRAGAAAAVEVRVFASASWKQERVHLFVSANPGASAPTWTLVETLAPHRAGSQVLVADVTYASAGRHALRARLSPHDPGALPGDEDPPEPCGTAASTEVVDDHDDLVFDVAP
jgi:subtilisin family serine protease